MCEYDAIGNPTKYRGRTLTWQGRRLVSYGKENKRATYTYDVNNIRTSKTVTDGTATITSKYIYDENTLIAEQRNGEWIYYIYGVDGIAGFNYNGVTYLYRKNIQGDITHIYTLNGECVAIYAYDAFGNVRILQGENGIGAINPFRYRGYYYDTETGLYLVTSRYYNPEWCRFLNADSIEYLDPSNINGMNLYAYCLNNPVNYYDPDGHWAMPNWLKWVIGGVVIIGLGIATLATGGAAAGVAGFIVAGAFKGAVIGAISGALVSGTIGGIISAVAGNSFWGGFANGAADGFMSGAIIGGITGAISSSVQVANAAKSWATTGGKSGFKQMTQHYTKHVINEGQKSVAKNIVNYTKQAKMFFANNNASGYLLREGVIKIAGAPGGIFNTNGLIRSFWYVLL